MAFVGWTTIRWIVLQHACIILVKGIFVGREEDEETSLRILEQEDKTITMLHLSRINAMEVTF